MRWKSKLLKESIEVTDGNFEGLHSIKNDGGIYGVRFYVNVAFSKDEFRQVQLDTGAYIIPPCNFGTVEQFIKALQTDDYGQPDVQFEHIIDYLRQHPLRFMVHQAQRYWVGDKEREERIVPYNIGETYTLEEFRLALDAIVEKYKTERLKAIFKMKNIERRKSQLPAMTPAELERLEIELEPNIRKEQDELYRTVYNKARELGSIDPKTGKRKLASRPISGSDWKINYGKGTSDANIAKYLDIFMNAINYKITEKIRSQLFGIIGRQHREISEISFHLLPESTPETGQDLTAEQQKELLTKNIREWIKQSVQSYDKRTEESYDESYLIGIKGQVTIDFSKLRKLVEKSLTRAELVQAGDAFIQIIETGIINLNDQLAHLNNSLKMDQSSEPLTAIVCKWIGEQNIDGVTYSAKGLLSNATIADIKPQLEEFDIRVTNTTIIAKLTK